MFMGTTYNSIDEKNRMIVPSKLRAGLGARCILTKGLDRCLYIYTTEDWEKQMEKIARLPESDPHVRAFIRHFCANAAECEFDKQGRIGIPQESKKNWLPWARCPRSRSGQGMSGKHRITKIRWKRKILRRHWLRITSKEKGGNHGIQTYLRTP